MIDTEFKYYRNTNRITLFLNLKRWNLKGYLKLLAANTEFYLFMML